MRWFVAVVNENCTEAVRIFANSGAKLSRHKLSGQKMHDDESPHAIRKKKDEDHES